ncbi:group IID secretory phospholipase A2-like [Gracilinanus agilis]|uniref:group IID secretory phospholipase A2-like n=1 Tax=Gracilinanus agilis TaxID=191870 RepID=UPI001CFC5A0D|nr:group IID secretory phospholipase A2-like [Gracilinanus agilis]
MQLILLCIMLITSGMAPSQGSVLQLKRMIRQATGKNPIFSYLNYGCHCGPGGRGQPKDATDWCCKAHDCCYGHLSEQKCYAHVDTYKYKYANGDIECHGKSHCEKEICQCDKELALCLRRNLETYKKQFCLSWLFFCQGENPEC